MSRRQVRVYPLPAWIDVERLLGPGAWRTRTEAAGHQVAEATLDEADAADLVARLRGIGLAGSAVAVEIEPALSRGAVREARRVDARRRRETTAAAERNDLRMDAEGRISWTPLVLGRRMAERAAGWTVVDAGCGVGGNTIAFAEAGCTVTAIERDGGRLQMARQNLRCLGVADRVQLVQGDAVELVAGLPGDLLFIDPPWGTDWDRRCTRAEDLSPLLDLLAVADGFSHVWCKLPASIDPASLPGTWELEAMFGEGAGDRQRVKLVWARRVAP
jgi:hypothetical protein